MRQPYPTLLLIPLLAVGAALPAFAQDDVVAISGAVREAGTQQPLPGVSISVKHGPAGVLNDADGRFALKSRLRFPFTLVFNMLGYDAKEVRADVWVVLQRGHARFLGKLGMTTILF
ncbi:carboxypeptidase-like regulatory domain-containing protein [Hymenobacter algoricola]